MAGYWFLMTDIETHSSQEQEKEYSIALNVNQELFVVLFAFVSFSYDAEQQQELFVVLFAFVSFSYDAEQQQDLNQSRTLVTVNWRFGARCETDQKHAS
jgi:hypothetical protein